MEINEKGNTSSGENKKSPGLGKSGLFKGAFDYVDFQFKLSPRHCEVRSNPGCPPWIASYLAMTIESH
ncbi:MAG: hypothetical protein LBS88_09560 [Tannerellaceae bacterium]|nr:hypothetical protein [Tannerellaceae bacterium]